MEQKQELVEADGDDLPGEQPTVAQIRSQHADSAAQRPAKYSEGQELIDAFRVWSLPCHSVASEGCHFDV